MKSQGSIENQNRKDDRG